jgi:hypothetical protein
MSKYRNYLSRKINEYGNKFDQSDLSEQFVPYYESGQRIEVEFSHGEIKRGTIEVTTGWKPVFLLMLRSNSIRSSYTLSNQDKITKIIR